MALFYSPLGRKDFVMKSLVMPFVVGVFMVCCMFFGAAEAFADPAGNQVQYTSIVEFGNLFDTIRNALGPIVVGALGLGLAIWGARYIFGVIKSMGR